MAKIDFTPEEKLLVEEQFQAFMQAVNIIARLHGFTGARLATVQLAADRSGLIVPDSINAAPTATNSREPERTPRAYAPYDGNK